VSSLRWRLPGAVLAALLMLLSGLVPTVSAAVPPGPGGYNVLGQFDNRQDTRDLLFDQPGFNDQTAISLPNHAFVGSATVNMSFGVFPGSRSATWDPTLDVGEDGIVDWRFDSSRGGALGLQDTFSDGNSAQSMRFDDAGSSEFSIKLPLGGVVTDAYVDVEGFPLPHWVKQYTLTPRTDSPGEYGPKMVEYGGDLWVIWQTYDVNITQETEQNKKYSDVVVRKFDGTRWDRIVDLTSESDPYEDDIPQIIAYGGKLYAIWSKGDGKATPGGESEIVYRAYDGTSWSPQARISGPMKRGTVSCLNTYERCVVFQDRLYVVWKTTDPDVANIDQFTGEDEDIVYSSFDGTSWSAITEITAANNDYTDWSVDVISYRGMLYVIWDTWDTQGFAGNRDSDVVYRAFDGRTWSSQITLSPLSDAGLVQRGLDDALPRLYVFDNELTGEPELFAIWMRGTSIINPGSDGFSIVLRRYTGGEWLPMETISRMPAGDPVDQMFPSLIAFNDTLYAIWTIGTNTTEHPEGNTHLIATYGDIIIRSFDGETWSPLLELTPMGNGYDNASHPSIYVYKGKVYASWETPLPTSHDTDSWEIVMRHLELEPVRARLSVGETEPVVWGPEKLPNQKRRVHLDPAELTRVLHSAGYTHEDAYSNKYTELPVVLEVETPSTVKLSNLTIEYDYTATVDFTATAQGMTDAARDNTRTDRPVRINFKISTGQAGRVSLEHPKVEYYLDYPPWLLRPVPAVEVLEDEPRGDLLDLNDFFTDDWDAGHLSFIVLDERDPDGAVEPYLEGGRLGVRLPVPNWNGEVTLTVRAFDSTGFYHNDSNQFIVRVLPVNDPPYLDYIPDRTDLVLDEEHVEYANAHDVDGDPLRFSTDSGQVRIDARTGKLSVVYEPGFPRPLLFNVTVTDPSGAFDSQQVTWNYTVKRMRVETHHEFPYGLFLLLIVVLCLVAAERLRKPYRKSEEDQVWEEEAADEERLRAEESGSWLKRYF